MKVYVKTDGENRITAINSEAFIASPAGWTEIDDGEGDRFLHAQQNYLPKPVTDDDGVYRYRLSDGIPVERTAEETAADRLAASPRMSAEDLTLEMLADHEYRLCVMELGSN